MLAIVRQTRTGREAQGKHVQEAADLDELFEPSLSDLDLEQTVSLRMRFTRNRHQMIWNKNLSNSSPMVFLKQGHRGGHNV